MRTLASLLAACLTLAGAAFAAPPPRDTCAEAAGLNRFLACSGMEEPDSLRGAVCAGLATVAARCAPAPEPDALPEPPAFASASYLGAPPDVSGAEAITLRAAEYDEGGAGVGYLDAPGLRGGTDGGRTGSDVETGGGGVVGWTDAGDELRYTVSASEAAERTVTLSVATPHEGRVLVLALFAPGEAEPYASAEVAVPKTGGWNVYEDASAALPFRAGPTRLHVTWAEGGVNLASLTIAP